MSIEHVISIVSAYVSNNIIPAAEIRGLINTVSDTIDRLENPTPQTETVVEELRPACSVKKSVTQEYIICLEDGKKFKTMKRHLMSTYNMTPDDYRAKWGLPYSYPMTAPNYAAYRSQTAKSRGLGKRTASGVVSIKSKTVKAA